MPVFFFFNDPATTEIYTLSLHDALPISLSRERYAYAPISDLYLFGRAQDLALQKARGPAPGDRKSTRLNSSHSQISYAVFCLKKKKNNKTDTDKNHKHTRMERFSPAHDG